MLCLPVTAHVKLLTDGHSLQAYEALGVSKVLDVLFKKYFFFHPGLKAPCSMSTFLFLTDEVADMMTDRL